MYACSNSEILLIAYRNSEICSCGSGNSEFWLYGFRNSELWLNNFRNSGFWSYDFRNSEPWIPGFRNSEPGSQDSGIISKIRNSGIHSGGSATLIMLLYVQYEQQRQKRARLAKTIRANDEIRFLNLSCRSLKHYLCTTELQVPLNSRTGTILRFTGPLLALAVIIRYWTSLMGRPKSPKQ